MSEISKKFIIIGEFGAPHGVRGAIKINSATVPIEAISDYQPWYIKKNNDWGIVDIIAVNRQGSQMVAMVKDYNDRDQVKALTGLQIAVTRDQLPVLPATEYYWSDLEGLQVVNEQQIVLGVIEYLFTSGSNDIMVITGEKRYLVPFIPELYVLNVDLDKKVVTVSWDADF